MATQTTESTENTTINRTTEKARDAAHRAEEKATEMGKQAAQMAESKVEQRKSRVADGMHTFGEALRLGAQELRQRGQTKDTDYVERLANQAEHFSETLQQKGAREMAHEVENFARHNQALFLGGALALGVAGARFLKSTPHDDGMRRSGYEGPSDGYSMGGNPIDQEDTVNRPSAVGYAAQPSRPSQSRYDGQSWDGQSNRPPNA